MTQLDAAVTGSGIVPVFQPVVSLPDEVLVGYEALARWPSLDFPRPDLVFAHAAEVGNLDALDHACIRSSARAALDGRSTAGMLLLLNCEPTTLDIDMPRGTALFDAADSFTLLFELTERGLLRDPPALLRKVSALRDLGIMIALDDIGAHPDSLALLDIISPDVMKMDLGLVQRQPDEQQARTIAAVIAHRERTGAVILAEGIENDDHLEQALAYGATLGQGYRFGHPGPLNVAPATSNPAPVIPLTIRHESTETPFELATADSAARTVRKRTLIELSRHIERLAAAADSPPIVLFTLQSHDNFRGLTRDNYGLLAEKSPLIVAFAVDAPQVGDDSVMRWVSVAPDDRLALEWSIVVLGPDTAAALIARELDAADAAIAENDRRFEAVITFDRERVAQAARSLLNRCPVKVPAAGSLSA